MLVGIGQRGGVLHLAAPTPLVAALLQLTGLDSRFEISATVPEPWGRAGSMSLGERAGFRERGDGFL